VGEDREAVGVVLHVRQEGQGRALDTLRGEPVAIASAMQRTTYSISRSTTTAYSPSLPPKCS